MSFGLRKGGVDIDQFHLFMNFLSNIIFSILFGVDGPVNKVLKRYVELAFAEGNNKAESVGLLVEEHFLGLGGGFQIHLNLYLS